MPDTVRAIENESPIDSVRVYNRAGECLYENIRKEDILEKRTQTTDAKAAIVKERARPLSRDEQNLHNQQRKAVEEKMIARGAPAREISEAKAMMAGVKRTREGLSR